MTRTPEHRDPDPEPDDVDPDGSTDMPTLTADLQHLLGGGGDVGGRTAEGLERRLRSGSTSSLALELLGVGWWTAREILSDGRVPADGERGDRDG